jgi:hypothetical protein
MRTSSKSSVCGIGKMFTDDASRYEDRVNKRGNGHATGWGRRIVAARSIMVALSFALSAIGLNAGATPAAPSQSPQASAIATIVQNAKKTEHLRAVIVKVTQGDKAITSQAFGESMTGVQAEDYLGSAGRDDRPGRCRISSPNGLPRDSNCTDRMKISFFTSPFLILAFFVKWIDNSREKAGNASDLDLLQKTFDRMK